eukprot:GHVT01074355.1.p1 GENE.GHVT01074355.1~~GHVT01074355.1.p1  ORF type:complete len:963 (-),score=192.73 GHVT01074355.1:817-3705(-)
MDCFVSFLFQAELRSAPDLQHTKWCPRLLNNSICTSSSCQYAHSASQLRSGSDVCVSKTSLCTFYQRSPGACLNGTKCRFAHGLQELKERSLMSPRNIQQADDANFSTVKIEKLPACPELKAYHTNGIHNKRDGSSNDNATSNSSNNNINSNCDDNANEKNRTFSRHCVNKNSDGTSEGDASRGSKTIRGEVRGLTSSSSRNCAPMFNAESQGVVSVRSALKGPLLPLCLPCKPPCNAGQASPGKGKAKEAEQRASLALSRSSPIARAVSVLNGGAASTEASSLLFRGPTPRPSALEPTLANGRQEARNESAEINQLPPLLATPKFEQLPLFPAGKTRRKRSKIPKADPWAKHALQHSSKPAAAELAPRHSKETGSRHRQSLGCQLLPRQPQPQQQLLGHAAPLPPPPVVFHPLDKLRSRARCLVRDRLPIDAFAPPSSLVCPLTAPPVPWRTSSSLPRSGSSMPYASSSAAGPLSTALSARRAGNDDWEGLAAPPRLAPTAATRPASFSCERLRRVGCGSPPRVPFSPECIQARPAALACHGGRWRGPAVPRASPSSPTFPSSTPADACMSSRPRCLQGASKALSRLSSRPALGVKRRQVGGFCVDAEPSRSVHWPRDETRVTGGAATGEPPAPLRRQQLPGGAGHGWNCAERGERSFASWTCKQGEVARECRATAALEAPPSGPRRTGAGHVALRAEASPFVSMKTGDLAHQTATAPRSTCADGAPPASSKERYDSMAPLHPASLVGSSQTASCHYAGPGAAFEGTGNYCAFQVFAGAAVPGASQASLLQASGRLQHCGLVPNQNQLPTDAGYTQGPTKLALPGNAQTLSWAAPANQTCRKSGAQQPLVQVPPPRHNLGSTFTHYHCGTPQGGAGEAAAGGAPGAAGGPGGDPWIGGAGISFVNAWGGLSPNPSSSYLTFVHPMAIAPNGAVEPQQQNLQAWTALLQQMIIQTEQVHGMP